MRPHFFYFDLGNVLLYFDHDLAFRRMAKIAGVTPKQMRTAVMDTELQIAYETGHISGSEFVDRIAQHLDKPLDVESILEAAADMFIANTHILPVLERVKELRIPMGLLSNTCEAHWQWILHQRYPQVVDWFSPVILSFEAKSMKPDPGIYEQAEQRAGVAPEHIFFTDDRVDNIEAASNRGWQTQVFVNADRLMQTIDQWT
ncbi:MAG: HAD family phosphatase [Pirellula sp.]|jgi:putative hydrolase of the HAD superfamily|nr:HAD family phosphatase [Pirellula sp.]